MNDNTIMEVGMRSLVDSLGVVDAERFITKLIREPFDYTKWQRDLFSDMTLDEIGAKAAKYCKVNPR